MKARVRALIRVLPAGIALPLLTMIGALEWWLRPSRRAEATAQMELVLRGTAREGEVRALARRWLGRRRAVEELLWRPDVCARARVQGAQTLEALHARGAGALVLHTHMCWIAPQVYTLSAQHLADAIVLRIDDPPTPLQLLYRRVFAEWGTETITSEGSFEWILDRLLQGRRCQIAIDVPGSTACIFLDKPARLASGVAALAFASGVPIVPVHARLSGARLRVRVGDPVRPQSFADPAALTGFLADRASAEILAAPELYHEHDWLAELWPAAPLVKAP